MRRPDLTIATADHNVPTTGPRAGPVGGPRLEAQLEALARNCAEFGIACYPMGDGDQGIVHVIGPEQGLTQPGMTIVCGDSHTSPTARSGRSPSASGPPRSSTCSRPRPCPRRGRKTMAVAVDGELPPA